MRNSYLWQPWPGPRAPSSALDEAEFLRALRAEAGPKTRKSSVRRDDITLLMDALRCGLSYEELTLFAAGASPAHLLSAYNLLDRERLDVLASWQAVLDDPTVHVLADRTESIDRLLPAPTGHILAAINDGITDDELADLVRHVDAAIQRVHKEALAAEDKMRRATTPAEAAEEGLVLYNPLAPSLWNHPFFLAPRVGALSPSRVADLLGERHDDVSPPQELLSQFLPPQRRNDRA